MCRKRIDDSQPFYKSAALVNLQPAFLATALAYSNATIKKKELSRRREKYFNEIDAVHIGNPPSKWLKYHRQVLFDRLAVSVAAHWEDGVRNNKSNRLNVLQWKIVCITFIHLDPPQALPPQVPRCRECHCRSQRSLHCTIRLFRAPR